MTLTKNIAKLKHMNENSSNPVNVTGNLEEDLKTLLGMLNDQTSPQVTNRRNAAATVRLHEALRGYSNSAQSILLISFCMEIFDKLASYVVEGLTKQGNEAADTQTIVDFMSTPIQGMRGVIAKAHTPFEQAPQFTDEIVEFLDGFATLIVDELGDDLSVDTITRIAEIQRNLRGAAGEIKQEFEKEIVKQAEYDAQQAATV